MPKRKDQNEEDSSPEMEIIDVDFEFFDPAEIDYHAIKRLLRQLFQVDAELFHLNELTELILSQPLLGTTIKTDGKDSDPYAFLTVLNMNVHREHPSIKALISYFLEKSQTDTALHSVLQRLFSSESLQSSSHVGLILSERLVNMPTEVVPPMYRMLGDEIIWANDENEPYQFQHYIVLSRLYRLSKEDIEAMEEEEKNAPSSKRSKLRKKQERKAIDSFHPEDGCVKKVALHTLDYDFTNRQPRDPESFGLDTAGRLMVFPSSRFQELVVDMSTTFAPP